MSRKNLDTLINKWISRKLFVFLIASGLLMFADLDSSDWTLIAITYLSSQTILDSVTVYSKIRNNNNDNSGGAYS
jgi:hypothetical protein